MSVFSGDAHHISGPEAAVFSQDSSACDEVEVLAGNAQATLGQAAIQRLIEDNLALATAIAKNYRSVEVPFEDVLQSGREGLVRGVRRFNGNPRTFSTYVGLFITGSILRMYQNLPPVKPEKGTESLILQQKVWIFIRKTVYATAQKPSAFEIAQHFDFDEITAQKYLKVHALCYPLPLHEVDPSELYAPAPPDKGLLAAELTADRLWLYRAIARAAYLDNGPKKGQFNREIFEAFLRRQGFYGEVEGVSSIAQSYGRSRQWVGNIEKKILNRLRERVQNDELFRAQLQEYLEILNHEN